MKYVKEVVQAAVLALLFGGPMFAYFLFVMKP
jgi:hypothetical protein